MHRRQFMSTVLGSGAALAAPRNLYAVSRSSEDIRLLGQILRALHPGLIRYLSPQEFDSELDRLQRVWDVDSTLDRRFLNLTRFLARLRCGHSYPSFFNQAGAVERKLFSRANRLPFAFRWIGEAMVVTRSYPGSTSLPIGSEVTSINGLSTRAILDRLLPLARADGANDGKRRALLSVTGADTIETFDVLFGLEFDVPDSRPFTIRYRPPGATDEIGTDVAPIDLDVRKRYSKRLDTRGDEPFWDWSTDVDGIATLTMPSWAVYNTRWDWQAWLEDRLDGLRGATGLMVDLRENEGGNDCGDPLLARLAGRDVLLPRVDRLVRYRKVPTSLNAFLDTWDDSFRDWGEQARPFDERFLRLIRHDDRDVIPARGPRLALPVVVLIGPQNSSATFQFASLVRATGLGTLVGEATGGNRRGINGGAFFFARLPESGIEFDLPLIGYFPSGGQPDAGIDPDVSVSSSASDIAEGRDRVMEVGREMLLKAKSRKIRRT